MKTSRLVVLIGIITAASVGVGQAQLPFRLHADLEYTCAARGSGCEPLTLDLYLPPSEVPVPHPTLIFLHGGGWFENSKTTDCPAAHFVRHDYAVACVDYRLARHPSGSCDPWVSFPGQIQDVKTAVRWLRLNAAVFGLDANRFAAIGTSSGAHLAALLGTSSGEASLQGSDHLSQSDEVQAVVDWYGPVDIRLGPVVFTASACSAPPSVLDPYKSNPYFYWTTGWSYFLGGALFDPAVQTRAAAASPLSYVNRTDPPFLILHGDVDTMVPLDQSVALANALPNVVFKVITGMGHGFYQVGVVDRIRPDVLQETLDFLAANL